MLKDIINLPISKHLNDVAKYQNEDSSMFILYFKHLWFCLREFTFFIYLALATLIHGIFPFIFTFKHLLLPNMQMIERAYKLLPNHPAWERWGWKDKKFK